MISLNHPSTLSEEDIPEKDYRNWFENFKKWSFQPYILGEILQFSRVDNVKDFFLNFENFDVSQPAPMLVFKCVTF